MASLTSIDLTGLDLARVARATRKTADSAANRAVALASDATYVTVGFGVLALQRLQVRRRGIERALRR